MSRPDHGAGAVGSPVASISWGGRTPYWSMRVLRTMPVVVSTGGLTGGPGGIAEVLGGAQHEADLAVDLGELDDLGLLCRDREDDELGGPGEGGAGGAGGPRGARRRAGGGRRQERPDDLHVLEQELGAGGVEARRHVELAGRASSVTWGILSAVKPIRRSTRSPTLMSVPTPVLWSTVTAIARRPGIEQGRHLGPAAGARGEHGRADLGTLLDVGPDGLADHRPDVAVGIDGADRDIELLGLDHVLGDHRAQGDVLLRVHRRQGGRRRADGRLALVRQHDHAGERRDGKDDADDEDKSIGPLQRKLSRLR